MRFLPLLFLFAFVSPRAFAVDQPTQADIQRLINAGNNTIYLADNTTYLIWYPININDNQSIIGGNNSILELNYSDGEYWKKAIVVQPSITNPSLIVGSITSTYRDTRIQLLAPLPTNYLIGSKVVLAGYSNSSQDAIQPLPAKQSLTTSIKSISNSRKEIILQDPLRFTIVKNKQDITLTLVNSNVKGKIQNIFFKTNSGMKDNGLYYIYGGSMVTNFTIDNCSFDGTGDPTQRAKQSFGVFIKGGSLKINNSTFTGFNISAIELDDADYSTIISNTFKNCDFAIRLLRTQGVVVSKNTISNGRNLLGGGGIFLSSDDFGRDYSGDKSFGNIINYNKIDNAAYGNVGNISIGQCATPLAGIHLHRNSSYNLISNNTSSHNGLGIYLETNNDFNMIANNNCSDNNQDIVKAGGVINIYGGGIQLDYNNDNNTIESNTCNNNNGITHGDANNPDWSSMTGIGIEIRNGKPAQGGIDYDNKNNLLSKNTCKNNGSMGMRIVGTSTEIYNNEIQDNGTNIGYVKRHNMWVEGENQSVHNNNISGGNTWKNERPFNFTNIEFTSKNSTFKLNKITTNYYSDGCIHIGKNSSNTYIGDNTFIGYSCWLPYIEGYDAPQSLNITNNVFSITNNGWPTISLRNPANYAINGNTSTITIQIAYDNLLKSLHVDESSFEPSLMSPKHNHFYPNPAKDYIYIEEPSMIELYNSMGQIVMTIQTSSLREKINISHLDKGLYIIRIKNPSSTSSSKLVIN